MPDVESGVVCLPDCYGAPQYDFLTQKIICVIGGHLPNQAFSLTEPLGQSLLDVSPGHILFHALEKYVEASLPIFPRLFIFLIAARYWPEI